MQLSPPALLVMSGDAKREIEQDATCCCTWQASLHVFSITIRRTSKIMLLLTGNHRAVQ